MVAGEQLIGKVFAQLALDHVAELLLDAGLVREVAECEIKLRPEVVDGVEHLLGAFLNADVTLSGEVHRRPRRLRRARLASSHHQTQEHKNRNDRSCRSSFH
jgi:hypothetical protein